MPINNINNNGSRTVDALNEINSANKTGNIRKNNSLKTKIGDLFSKFCNLTTKFSKNHKISEKVSTSKPEDPNLQEFKKLASEEFGKLKTEANKLQAMEGKYDLLSTYKAMEKKLGSVKNKNDLKTLLTEDSVGKGFQTVFIRDNKMKRALEKLGISLDGSSQNVETKSFKPEGEKNSTKFKEEFKEVLEDTRKKIKPYQYDIGPKPSRPAPRPSKNKLKLDPQPLNSESKPSQLEQKSGNKDLTEMIRKGLAKVHEEHPEWKNENDDDIVGGDLN